VPDTALTFGAAPRLSGAGMAVTAGDRVCLVLKRLLGLRRTGARSKTTTEWSPTAATSSFVELPLLGRS